jgi:adenylate cyclase
MLGELHPQGGGDVIPLLQSKLIVGRRGNCDIALRFPNVSSQHCELEMLDGYWHVRDLASSNGTRVNGVRVESQWLLPGDELCLATHFYKVAYTPRTDAPPPSQEVNFNLGLLEKAGLSKRHLDRQDDYFPAKAPRPNLEDDL